MDLSTSFSPGNVASVDARIWAATALADLPTVIHYRTDRTVEIDTTPDGVLMRCAFSIWVVLGHRFAINLHAGASEQDLAAAHRIIAKAKSGLFLEAGIWEAYRADAWVSDVSWSWNGEDHFGEIRECAEPGCIEPHHSWVDGEMDDAHTGEEIREANGWYLVRPQKEEGERWKPCMDISSVDTLDTEADVRVLENALNDFRWVQGECDRLNQTVVQDTVKEAA